MLLWDYESESWASPISGMSEEKRRDLALSCIEGTVESFRPSFETSFTARTVSFVGIALRDFRANLGDPGSSVAVRDEEAFFDGLHALVDEDPAPGLAALVMAVSEYADCLRNRPLGSREVLGVLSSCYEAILNEERIPRVTPDAERANANCRRVLDMQQRLVIDFSGR
ncbi:hypothetical protein AB0P02_20775 [Streptomyces griseoluteus]|jgi:hypothetical protein|uniref:hypothetical protein n=1 Tax=Streptomyces griseoluteus TaxID=29306 RepID=UPI00342CE744